MSESVIGWKPDTCDCTFLVTRPCDCDGTLPQNYVPRYVTAAEADAIHRAHPATHAQRPAEGKVTGRKFADHEDYPCNHHAQHGRTAARYSAVLNENRRKNLTHGIVRSRDVSFFDRYVWSFDDDRVLHVNVSAGDAPFTAGHKAAIQAICDVQFGVGAVVVE